LKRIIISSGWDLGLEFCRLEFGACSAPAYHRCEYLGWAIGDIMHSIAGSAYLDIIIVIFGCLSVVSIDCILGSYEYKSTQ
jgi:hypothetical protein